MLVRPPELEVPDDDAFRFDALDRARLEEPLSEFVGQATGSFVLAVDGGWGSGKTTFIRMWKAKLISRGHLCLYFNAWETDFAQDPLVALVGELSSTISELSIKGKEGAALKKQLKRTKAVAVSVLRRSIPVAIRLATAGILDLDALTEAQLAALTSDIAREQLDNYLNARSEVDHFKSELTKLVQKLATFQGGDRASKIVIFVDELDRCRPSYAVELLERVKHLFDVENLIFILGIDRSQLSHSVKAIYGREFDASGYLRRFIDIDYRLPEPPRGNYCKHLLKVFGVEDFILSRRVVDTRSEFQNLEAILASLFSAANFTLREQVHTISRLRVVMQTVPGNHYLFEWTLGVLVFLREWNPEYYTGFFSGTITADMIIEELEGLPGGGALFDKHGVERIIEAILLGGSRELEFQDPRLSRYESLVRSEETSPEEARAKNVLQILTSLPENFTEIGFRVTEKRLALVDNLVPVEEEAANRVAGGV